MGSFEDQRDQNGGKPGSQYANSSLELWTLLNNSFEVLLSFLTQLSSHLTLTQFKSTINQGSGKSST